MTLAAADEGGCSVRWPSLGAEQILPGCDAATAAFDADPYSGTAVVGTAEGVQVVTPDGVEAVAPAADRIAWDPAEGVIYATELGGDHLAAWETDGSLRWERTTDGAVHALAEAGASGAVAVVLGTPDGRGALQYLDGVTGEVRASVGTPAPADDVTVSADGSTVGLVVPRGVHFYRVSGPWR